MGLMWNTADLSSRPIASASADYIGQFVWSEYWGKWDEVLACEASSCGGTVWTVRGLDGTRVRRHSTAVPVDCIHAAPDIVGGAHRPPLALPNLAVLRAAVERVATQRYFGSAVGLGYWLADTQRRGLVDDSGAPTAMGVQLSHDLALQDMPSSRATLWPDAAATVRVAADRVRQLALGVAWTN